MRSILPLVVLAACGSVQSDAGGGGGGGGGACRDQAPRTTYASCTDDSDCYSGWCHTSGTSAFCDAPTRAARNALHGYDCSSNADCNAVLDPDVLASGVSGICHDDATYDGCAFYCAPGGSGGGGAPDSGMTPAPDGGSSPAPDGGH